MALRNPLSDYDGWKTDYPDFDSPNCVECDRSTGDGGRDESHEMWCSEHPTHWARYSKAAASVVRDRLKDAIGTSDPDMHFTDVVEKQVWPYTIIHEIGQSKGAWVTARFFVGHDTIEEAL